MQTKLQDKKYMWLEKWSAKKQRAIDSINGY
jgi:hypothetical protein